MGRHELVRRRRTSSVLLAAIVAPAAVFLAAAADINPKTDTRDASPVAAPEPVCCLQVVPLPGGSASVSANGFSSTNIASGQLVSASRLRVVQREVERILPVGVAPERGLQVKTILAARSISAVFPEISNIGGVRPDALRWHPNGLALDVMIPNPSSAEGIALGNQIVAYVLKNADRFGVQDAIWRGMYYTPHGAQNSGLGHYDHVHVTTTGGGYPSGNESYVR